MMIQKQGSVLSFAQVFSVLELQQFGIFEAAVGIASFVYYH